MGCAPSFYFKPKNFDHVLTYCEKTDPRLGQVIIVHQMNDGNKIFKKVSDAEGMQLTKKIAIIEKAFGKFIFLTYKIEGFQHECINIGCSSDKKIQKQLYMVTESLDKDLNTDIYVRNLKSRKFSEEELWRIIFFVVVVFFLLEKNNLPFCSI